MSPRALSCLAAASLAMAVAPNLRAQVLSYRLPAHLGDAPDLELADRPHAAVSDPSLPVATGGLLDDDDMASGGSALFRLVVDGYRVCYWVSERSSVMLTSHCGSPFYCWVFTWFY